MVDQPDVKWWGWGDPKHEVELPQAALDRLRAALGAEARRAGPVALEAVELSGPRLSGKLIERLSQLIGADWVRQDRLSRVVHAAGKGYVDLIRVRSGHAEGAPDAVVYPQTAEQVREILAFCVDNGIAVVPFGGGTSVVGGVEPVRDSFDALISLDLNRLDKVEVDRRSLTATLGAGLRGPDAEEALARSGVTLGHFPQSFEYATVGGWVATRSAGQASTGFGKIEEMVVGLECVSPSGEIDVKALPATAAGPQLRELFVGSEGALGVITEATLKVRPCPRERRYEGWMLKGFAEGADAFRELEQEGAAPDVARLSDEAETMLSFELSGGAGVAARLGRRYVKARGYEGGCLAILGFEGERNETTRRYPLAARILRKAGALSLGARPGKAWLRGRYEGPYLRDALLDNCLLVETLETAAQWSDLMDLYAAVREAIRNVLAARGTPPLVMCHISHLYPNGASLYFTFIAAQEQGAELEQWRAAKSAATDAIVSAGGTITHHHAVGRDHAAWLSREIGDLGVELLRSMKERLDPAGIMNPGKLITSGHGGGDG